MLVLSRKHRESIRIGDKIKLTVLEVRGSRVRLGVDAPQDICVKRAEVRDSREDDGPTSRSE
jgi:carbon storage regulator